MKLFLCLLALALCVEPEAVTYEGLRVQTEDKTGTTLVIFYDPESRVEHKNEMIKDVNKIILSQDKYKDATFIISGINVDTVIEKKNPTEDPVKLVNELGLNVFSLRHNPTIAAYRNGWSTWVHGDNAVSVLEKKLADFDVKAKEDAQEKAETRRLM